MGWFVSGKETQAILHDENAVLPVSSLIADYLDMRVYI